MLHSSEEGAMGKTQPTYSKEFKQQAVKLCETSGKTKTQISGDLGISDSSLSKWCKEFETLEQRLFQEKDIKLFWKKIKG
jgi:transposase